MRATFVLVITYVCEALLVSTAYFGGYLVDIGINLILNATLFQYDDVVSLVFLPHGVAVLVAWLYGFKALPLLLIPAAWMHSHLIDSHGFWSVLAYDPLLALVIVPTVFLFARSFGLCVASATNGFNWRHIMGCGFVAAFLCTIIPSLINGSFGVPIVVLFAGGVIGQIAFFALLLVGYRTLRWFPKLALATPRSGAAQG